MGLLLLVAGFIAIAGGLGAFAYGVVDPAFGRLHTTVATIAVVGGFGVLGLGALIASISRLAEAIEAQARHLRSAPPAEPRPPAAASMGAAAVAAALGEPLSPAPSRATAPVAAPPTQKPSPEPQFAPPPAIDPRSAPEAAMAPPFGAVPAPEPRDTAHAAPVEWSDTDLGQRDHPPAQPSARESPLPPSVQPVATPRSEPLVLGFDAAEDRQPGEPPSGPQVLKAGVIEGMAYTLYSDGSVDAELPEGTRHFASIAEWRSYLREGV